MKSPYLIYNGVTLLLFLLINCQSDQQPQIPQPKTKGFTGIWSGNLSFEHDITEHPLQLNFNQNTFFYSRTGCAGELVPDTLAKDLARFRLVAEQNIAQCGELSGGIAEIRRLDKAETLYMQYWPEGEVKLFLAQLERNGG